jgi:hypothetical protein
MPYTVTSDEEEWRVEERRQVRSRFEELLTVRGKKQSESENKKARKGLRSYLTVLILYTMEHHP